VSGHDADTTEHERLRLNETSHRGARGSQSPLEGWMSRKPVSREDRMRFKSLVRWYRPDGRSGLCREAGPEWTWEARARATVARQSIRRSLEASGLLEIRNSRNSSSE